MEGELVVRRVREDEWERLRALRLRALAEAPLAFGSTLAGEQTLPDQTWRQRAAQGAEGDARPTFIAERGTYWLGMVTCLLEDGGRGERPAWVVGMWVSPDRRRRGVGQALLTAGATWARTRGADVLNLHVTETNNAAIALYERLGFRATGETEPLRHTPALRARHMACPLSEFRAH